MRRFKMEPAMRVFLLLMAIITWLGIMLTEFRQVNWLLYIPAVVFTFNAVTGYCPLVGLLRTVLPKNPQ